MKRRTLLKTATGAAVLAGAGSRPLQARVPAHNWEEHDFGPGPVVPDRLYQGPFPQYAPKGRRSRERRGHGHHPARRHRAGLRHGADRSTSRATSARPGCPGSRWRSPSKTW